MSVISLWWQRSGILRGGKEVRVWVKGDSPMLDATLTQIHRMVLSRGFAEQSLQPLIWDNQFS